MIEMKPAMFRYKMALAGYSDYDVRLIEECVGGNGSVVRDDYRYAVYEYFYVKCDGRCSYATSCGAYDEVVVY